MPNMYSYVWDLNTWVDVFGLMPFWKKLKKTGMGHHPIQRSHAKSTGLSELGTTHDSPSWYPDEIEGSDKLHEDLHKSLKEEGVPFNTKFEGSQDDLITKTKKSYKKFKQKGTLKIPKSGEIIADNVTVNESVDKALKWAKKKCK